MELLHSVQKVLELVPSKEEGEEEKKREGEERREGEGEDGEGRRRKEGRRGGGTITYLK